jgi:hypothetical protein
MSNLKAHQLPDICDLCTRCHRLKTIRRRFADNKAEAQYRIQGPCDRCGSRSLDLWPMIEKNALDRINDAIG